MLKKPIPVFGLTLLFGISAHASIMQAAFAKSDAALNDAYQNLIFQIRHDNGQNSQKEQLLKDAQREWVTYRDKKCAFEAYLSDDDKADESERLDCMATISDQRTQELVTAAQ